MLLWIRSHEHHPSISINTTTVWFVPGHSATCFIGEWELFGLFGFIPLFSASGSANPIITSNRYMQKMRRFEIRIRTEKGKHSKFKQHLSNDQTGLGLWMKEVGNLQVWKPKHQLAWHCAQVEYEITTSVRRPPKTKPVLLTETMTARQIQRVVFWDLRNVKSIPLTFGSKEQ